MHSILTTLQARFYWGDGQTNSSTRKKTSHRNTICRGLQMKRFLTRLILIFSIAVTASAQNTSIVGSKIMLGTSASVTNSGTASNPVLNFTISQGLPSNVTVGPVTQGSTGSSASVINFGTLANAVQNFTILTAPSTTDRNAPHLATPNADTANNSFVYINSIPQADRFAGADICAKIRTAATYAISKGIGQVDATHFSGTQACASDPLGGLVTVGNWANLVVNLGNVHIQTGVIWNINNQGVILKGMGPYATQIEYTGPSSEQALFIGTSTPATTPLQGILLSDLFVYGDNSNLTDAILAQGVLRSEFRNIFTWGARGCGIHTKFAVADTFYRPHTSLFDAGTIGIHNSSHSTPAHGLCFDQVSGLGQTTAGTVIDAIAEYLTSSGWWLQSASSMVFTAGTSENNTSSGGPGGLEVDSTSNHNTFLNIDLEGNSNEDALDNGMDSHYIGIIAASPGGIRLGPTSQYTVVSGSDQANVFADASAASFEVKRGSEVVNKHQMNSPNGFNGAALGFNHLGNGDADYYDDVSVGPYAHAFFVWKGSSYFFQGGFTTSGAFNAANGFLFNGTAGFTGTRTVGKCVFTIQGGIITNVTGCS